MSDVQVYGIVLILDTCIAIVPRMDSAYKKKVGVLLMRIVKSSVSSVQ